MGLQIENGEKIVREQAIQKSLYQYIDERKCFVFNAGAGSGKTYALVLCLKYLIENYGMQLSIHNQGILCITYTNAAANHIKEEIGNTNLVKVSTIHERIWDLIKNHQAELLELHVEKIKAEMEKAKESLRRNEKYQKLQDEQENFVNALKAYKKECRNAARNSQGADEFRKALPKEVKECSKSLLKSVADFKKVMSQIFKIDEYQECLESIEKEEKGYSKVEYDARYNTDWLVKMRISHDTVLEYGEQIVKKYDVLKQMIIDSFPYIFIDEYQDTSVKVVQMMSELDNYSKSGKHSVCIGYFGDTVQSIYSDGIGEKLQEYHKIENIVDKKFNRRSYTEIIQVANQFRDDSLIQESIYADCEGGSVEVFIGSEEVVEKFINYYKEEWQASSENQIHCFVTRNEDVAEQNGFGKMYSLFKDADAYKGIQYEQLNSELLSNRIENLGSVPALFFRIIHFYVMLHKDETMVRKLLCKLSFNNMRVEDLRELIEELRTIKGDTLEDILSKMEEVAQRKKDKDILKEILDLDQEVSVVAVKNFIRKKLFHEIEGTDSEYEEKEQMINEKVAQFLMLSIEELKKWYQYIIMSVEEDVVYHTYHGTKGLEYENVLMIMGDGIGTKKKTLFKDYFTKNSNGEKEEAQPKYIEARNLLYVAVTRAIRNLRILYVGTGVNEEQLKIKFKNVKNWSEK